MFRSQRSSNRFVLLASTDVMLPELASITKSRFKGLQPSETVTQLQGFATD